MLSRQRPPTSLRLALSLPFVLLIALLTAALAGLGYWTSSKTVASMSQPQRNLLTVVYQDVVVGTLFLLLATLIGARIFGDVVNDMRTLTSAVRRVGQGDIDVPL